MTRNLLALGLWLALVASPPARADDTVVVHRCVDAKGRITLQDNPCPAGQQDTALTMQRPKDAPAPPPPAATASPPPEPAAPPAPAPAPRRREPAPMPPLYKCTSYDGIERYSESYDPNPRCEPLGLYYPPAYLTPESARMCRWVEDSCVKLSDADACNVWQQRLEKARSDLLHSFSDTQAYRESEVRRIGQIVEEHCR